MKKLLLTLVGLIILLVAIMAFLWNKPYPGAPNGATSTPDGAVPVAATTTIRGVFACLPHKSTSGTQTMECAYGMKSDAGEYYALDFSGTSASAFDLPMDREYEVTGLFVPVEALSSDNWQAYDIAGVVRVSSYTEIASDIPTAEAGKKLTLELNKPVVVSGTTIKVTAVVQDSRCPSDVQCIQAGRVIIALYTASREATSTVQTTIGQTVTANGLAITLDKVDPYPLSAHRATDQEYRFMFSVAAK